jgi:hypothetical protein
MKHAVKHIHFVASLKAPTKARVGVREVAA